MTRAELKLFPELERSMALFASQDIEPDRRLILDKIAGYIYDKMAENQEVNLLFVCTHNSRRSQLGQAISRMISSKFGYNIMCYSAGTEVTRFNLTAVQTLINLGFKISGSNSGNNHYDVKYAEGIPGIKMYSKLIDEATLYLEYFAAIMTCSEADENCPYIPGAEQRIALRYEDPGQYDGTSGEKQAYRDCALKIGAEMYYLFSQLSTQSR